MDIYKSVPAAHLKRSMFSRRRERNMTMDMGFIYPFFWKEMIPGDIFKLYLSAFIRVQPMVAAPFTPMRFYAEFWYFPTRVIMQKYYPEIVDAWETFIFGGPAGDGKNDAGQTPTLPRWIPKAKNVKLGGWHVADGVQSRRTGNADAIGSLWDYFRLPTDAGYNNLDEDGELNGVSYLRWCPLAFPKICYNMLWNEFKRNENFEQKVDLDSEDIQQCKWKHEYFSSALPFQQRGDPVAMPLGQVLFSKEPAMVDPYQLYAFSNSINGDVSSLLSSGKSVDNKDWTYTISNNYSGSNPQALGGKGADTLEIDSSVKSGLAVNSSLDSFNATDTLSSVAKVSRFPAYTQANVDVSDLRLMFQTQKFMERAARGGVRYIEGLLSFFGTSPKSDVLNLPVFIGGMKQNIIVNEVLQTSETANTPQGNIAGRGISAARDNIGVVHAKEHGYLMGICWIKPDLYYSSQGIPRELLRESRFDFYWPQFAHLSERPIYKAELFAKPSAMSPAQLGEGTEGLFGFTGMYNEYRSEENEITGHMRDTFKYWHLAREFSSAPELGSDFVNCTPRKDIFAYQDEDSFLVDILTEIKMYRPIPIEPNPGLIDHF